MILTIVGLVILWGCLYGFDDRLHVRETIGEYIVQSPLLRTLTFVLTTVLTGILCSAFVSEMTIENGKIDYVHFYNAESFKYLVIVVEVYFIYNWLTYSLDADILKYSDERYVNAYITKKSLPDVVKQVSKKLEDGTLPIDDWKKSFNSHGDNYRR